MRNRLLAALAALAFASPAVASTTYANISGLARSRTATCTTGTEAAPSAATDGINLGGVGAVNVLVCADSGQTITGGTGVDVYIYDAHAPAWAKSDQTLTPKQIATGARCAGTGFKVYASTGRFAAVPNGLTVSSGSITIYLLAVGPKGIL